MLIVLSACSRIKSRLSYYKLPELSLCKTIVAISYIITSFTIGHYMNLKKTLIDPKTWHFHNTSTVYEDPSRHNELVWDAFKMLRRITRCVHPAVMYSKLCLSSVTRLPGHLLSQTCQCVDISLYAATPNPTALMSHYPFFNIFSENTMNSYCQ